MTDPPELTSPFVFYDVRTTDLPGSAAFYAGMFSWPIERVAAGDQELSFVMGPQGPVAGFTELSEGDDRSPMWIPYVRVDDVEAAAKRATSLGGTVVRGRTEVPQGSLIVLREPGGALLSLWQDRAS